MIERIEKSSLFKNARLVSADENKSYNRPGVGFEMIFDTEKEDVPLSLSSRTYSRRSRKHQEGRRNKSIVVKKREKILIFFAILGVAIWAFDRFYYAPQKKKIATLREEAKAADLKLKEFVLFTEGVETVETEVTRLEKELQRLSDKMFRPEEFRTFLKHLRNESERLQMKMISMTTQEERPSLPEGWKSPSAFQYRKVAIQTVLRSRLNPLRTYLKGIEESPFQVAVDHLRVERIGDGTSFLKVTMGLSVFVVL